MTIKVTLPITNPGSVGKRVIIPKGMIIEIATPGMQNVVAAKTTTVDLKPGQTTSIQIDAYCLNQDKGWPHQAAAKLTKQTLGVPFSGQEDVWKAIASPDLDNDPMADSIRRLRREMKGLLSRHGDLLLVAADIGVKYDNLNGDTLDEKSYYLIEYCRTRNLLPNLVDRLLEDFGNSVVLNDLSEAFKAVAA